MTSTPWLVMPAAPGARVRLYCFSYAGGNAAQYAPWRAPLAPGIQVCAIELPGHGMRLDESPWRDLDALVAGIVDAMPARDALPFAFFGHSLGALMAFEVARERRRRGLSMPCHMFLSGCAAPALRPASRSLHTLDDAGLIAALRDLNGTPAALLEHRDLLDLMLPIIRADFALAETYAYRDGAPLAVPFSVFAGTGDDRTTGEQVTGWARETAAPCGVRWFEGDHFFINPQRTQVLDCVRGTLLTPSSTTA